jgi:hypothetical protein
MKEANMIRTIESSKFNRDGRIPLTPTKIGIWSAIYCSVALGLEWYASGLLLFAWIMAGFLVFSVYLTLDRNGSLINPFTIVFALGVVLCVAGYVYVHFLP